MKLNLPESDKPWRAVNFQGRIVFCNPDHPVMTWDGEKLVKVLPTPTSHTFEAPHKIFVAVDGNPGEWL